MFDLTNKIIIVTGAGGFLGKNFCKFLLSFNATVIAIDLDKQKLKKLREFIKELGLATNSLITYECNILHENQVKKTTKLINKKFKKIDVLVNNATFRGKHIKEFYKEFTKFKIKSWNEISETNIEGTFLITKHVSKLMIKKKEGSIIQIGSIYSKVAPNFDLYSNSFFKGEKMSSPAVYSVNKFGLVGLTKYLASYLGKYNIRVNCLSPGGIDDNHSKAFKKKYSSYVPLKRMGKVEDLAGAIIFLSSDKSLYVTGENILIDGGLSSW
jgi:NAD(P)-dependent dehydrogenase (short-subunit alcohol dehydrogenase family)